MQEEYEPPVDAMQEVEAMYSTLETNTPLPSRYRDPLYLCLHMKHRAILHPSPSPLTSISDIVLSWSRGEWLIIDSHSYHPDFYINWRLRKMVGAVMSGEVYRALGPDGEVYRVEGWETEHKEEV